MLAVAKPPPIMFAAPAFRPAHSRHPSAPVVIRPTHTPGLLSLSKPPHTIPRSQQPQQQRQQRQSPRGKPLQRSAHPPTAPAQPSGAKSSPVPASKPENTTTPEKPKAQAAAVSSADKPPRGRQAGKPAKDKLPRSTSLSTTRAHARRPPHQPSPPPSTRIPSQAEVSSNRPAKPPRSQPSAPQRTASSNLFDPFVVNSTSDNESTPRDNASIKKAGAKAPAFNSPPHLANPSGKLARRRQLTAQTAVSSPTPSKAVPVPRRKENVDPHAATEPLTSRSESNLTSSSRRVNVRRASTQLQTPAWDSFPVCDDSADQADESDSTPPTTPIRESASVPSKKGTRAASWTHNAIFDNAPRTAPLASASAYPFVPPSPASTPTPAQRRRNHRRVPSEGVFNMSMDDESSSDTLEVAGRVPMSLPKRRATTEPRGGTPSSVSSSFMREAGFFAGSMFQNSPSPDDLPAPAFHP